MIDDYSNDLLRSGIIEAKAGNKEAARRYLDRALYMSQDHAAMAEGWFWMSQLVDDPIEKRKDLENCLSNDLQHARARRALAILDGKLKPDEIVDSEALPPAPERLGDADAQRFMRPKCGGRMSFAPDGQALVCEYCARSQSLNTQPGSSDEKDFIVAMATARGHDRPLAEQVFHCQGCGAEFILPADQISATCVYCGSPHVVNLEKSKDLLAPDGILPHAYDQKHVVDLLVKWVEQNKIEPEKKVEWPRGLYLPLWTFDLGGGIDYTGEMVVEDEITFNRHQPKLVHVSDTYPVMVHDFPIPASRKLSALFLQLIPSFDLKAVTAYDPGCLADWPAELYDIPMANASLDARSQAFASLKRDLPIHVSLAHLTSTSSANIAIESFKLDLLPVWLTEIALGGASHLVLINGQNGTIQSDLTAKLDKLAGGLTAWLGDLVKD
jgi:hypothetical protein